MNAPIRHEVLQASTTKSTRASEDPSPALRYVWEGLFGVIVIEVVGDIAYVNGQAVEPAGDLIQPCRAAMQK